MQNGSSELSLCPSFNIYSSDNNNLVDIADTVSRDFKNDAVSEDEEFEFVNTLSENPEMSSSSFPIFNRRDGDNVEQAIRIPLRDLFIGDRDIPFSSSSSSSEADELEGLPADTYCVWKPKQSPESSPNSCKKSTSAGSSSSSKRWRFIKDLLKRSNSTGNVSSSSSFSFLNLDKNEEKVNEKTAKATTKVKRDEKSPAAKSFYVGNKVLKEGDKRRSYLPYRQDLVGIFANIKV
ncbi:hypothetical protein ERO13_D07G227700v2 [Gossypium hirsutum]|uniref:Uncharacterized protein n=2 Tax=Gossypium TaxID=3633 RepID=A0A1U8LHE5_GOSHI|nr:uncharacterized protein LOC107926473 [Gossypium hirsutum]KAB2022989.1 hypothetical protein ES319_D07G251400v1 [Gossypium barbadense]KAG4139969.1 hypothetical protein ERO13_D07G227700v2 [Gossypium hirsutum]PPD93093.1 hypothetical protein GOBAR_DD09987 [Gossypium barbadense]